MIGAAAWKSTLKGVSAIGKGLGRGCSVRFRLRTGCDADTTAQAATTRLIMQKSCICRILLGPLGAATLVQMADLFRSLGKHLVNAIDDYDDTLQDSLSRYITDRQYTNPMAKTIVWVAYRLF